ncbi:MAG: tyrosine-type recombinase/integrase [Pseudonocardiaceae bacterium]|nr:tyrosine-type recombinase/integrase [Pseudonocardiaceae bacterium]
MLLLKLSGQDRLIVDTFLGTGMRWEELAGLRVYRVDRRKRTVTIREVLERDGSLKEVPKSSAGWRVVPLTERLARKIGRYLHGKNPDDFVFTAPGGGPWQYTKWRARVWAPAVQRAGLSDPQPTIHDLRHTWCSELANGGMPLSELKVISGHSRISSLERYLHASPSRLDRARGVLESRHGVGTPTLVPVRGGRKSTHHEQKKTRSELRDAQSG